MMQAASGKARRVSRFWLDVFRATLCALLSTLWLLTSCAPAILPPQPTPRIIFPTDRPVATPAATPTPTPTPTPRPTPAAPPLTEYRALWVDGFNSGLQTAEQVTQLVRDCQSISCNMLLVQIRIHANALHAQSSEPRSADFPEGFDPLADVISKAHAVSPPIEVHAWINALPIWPTEGDLPTEANHILNQHGPGLSGVDNWIALNEQGNTSGTGLYYLDPGNPDGAAYVVHQVVSVVKDYAVDGVHLDFMRYGGIQWGYNPTSVARFRARFNRTDTPAPDDAQWSQWRRDQVSAVVRRIWLESTAANPRIKVSAALIPWGDGPATDAAWKNSSAYSAVFQDWRAWLEEGILDIGIPMNYYPDSTMASNFDHWIEFEKTHRYSRHVIVGMGNYMNSLDESLAQIRRARTRSPSGARADGVSLYVYNQTNKDQWPFSQFVEATTLNPVTSPAIPVFAPHALIPSMPWKSEPKTGHLMGFVTRPDKLADGATVTLNGPTLRTAAADGNGFYGFVDLTPGVYRISSGSVVTSTLIRAGVVSTVTLRLER